jgi:hypothetical protein
MKTKTYYWREVLALKSKTLKVGKSTYGNL